ncbi:AtpZ/AtpI family protein [Polaribacter sp. Hel1_85]|uniref:AtpZ/AtpI family protein n=1 Tax=Polaribacter sp. Hel1_85 TaxID=1250005 RepID=UPI00052CC0E6|nr:AtpZ/AtpI family protein [Polaribacter sp. Hel1_85]KGL62564.1 putative F0F1-ATPase subunit (ATPase gene1) [Polaribacter sp. Hel1_85]
MNKKDAQKKPLNKAIQLSGAGLQMGLTIYLGFLLGKWLDVKFETSFLKETVTLLAIFLAMYSLIKKANKING